MTTYTLLRRGFLGLSRAHCLCNQIRLSSMSTSPPGPSQRFRHLRTFSLATTLSLTAYALGSLFPPPALTIIYPPPSPPPPDPSSPASEAYTASLEQTLQKIPFLQAMRSASDADEWYETRPYSNFPEERRVNNLTAGALRGPGKLALKALIRAKQDESEAVAIVHVGRGVCGHDGIVHGGLLATLSDEILARIAINNLPDKVGVTANLSIDYRAPTRADQFIIFRTRLVEAKGRKTRVAGTIEDLKGTVLADISATFVQPKYAKLLRADALKQAMGEPEPRKDAPLHLADGVKISKA